MASDFGNRHSVSEIQKALYGFFSQFELPVYIRHHIPAASKMPYIVITSHLDAFLKESPCHVQIWARSPGFAEINETADKISAAIPHEGVVLPAGGAGAVILYRGSPFMQNIPVKANESENGKVKAILANITVKSYIA